MEGYHHIGMDRAFALEETEYSDLYHSLKIDLDYEIEPLEFLSSSEELSSRLDGTLRSDPETDRDYISDAQVLLHPAGCIFAHLREANVSGLSFI